MVCIWKKGRSWGELTHKFKKMQGGNEYVILVGPDLYSGHNRSNYLFNCVRKSEDNLRKVFKRPQYVRNDRSGGGREDSAECGNP